MSVTIVAAIDLRPGDRVNDGNASYEVQAVEQSQGRLLVIDTDGLVHPDSAGTTWHASRG